MDDGTPPICCPRCRKTLYPIALLRPQASLCVAARIILSTAVLLATSVFWLVVFWVWHSFGLKGTTAELAAILSALALPPGLGIGWLAYRLPRVLRLRCSSCGWYETYRLARLPRSGGTVKAARPAPASVPAPTQNPGGIGGESPFDWIVDDGRPRDEAAAWAYAEVAAGRVVEDVAADLIASGWSREFAEILAEEGRRQTSHLRDAGRRRGL